MSEAAADDPPAPRAVPIEPEPGAAEWPAGSTSRRGRWMASAGLLILAGLGTVWLARERIADGVIASQLRDLNLPATYRIESIGPTRQVLRDVVIGHPAHPDLVIPRAEVVLSFGLGGPRIGAVRLTRPRLYGTWQGNRISFGALDPLLFGPSDGQPPQLPALNLTVQDGRARVLGDHGPIGVSFEGQGGLRDGFVGHLGLVAPQLRAGGCTLERASLFGRVRIERARPALDGPLRLGGVSCPARGGLAARDVTMGLALRGDRSLDGGSGRIMLQTRAMAVGDVRANGWNGAIGATYRGGGLTARYDLIGRGLEQAQAAAGTLALSGVLRSRGALDRVEVEGTLDAGGVRAGAELRRRLGVLEQGGAETLAAPLLRQLRMALAREERGSHLRADYVLRAGAHGLNLVVPQGRLTGGSGTTLLALSRLQLGIGQGPARLAGNLVTAGRDLPQISARLEPGLRGRTRISLTMADYRAGSARLAVPRLIVEQDRSGALAFAGAVQASGALPGGQVTGLTVPIAGRRDARGRLALWPACTKVTFTTLAIADLALDGPGLRLCPVAGGAIVRDDGRGLRLAVGTPSLDLAGRLGGTPLRISSGAAGYAEPGGLFVSALDIVLGPAATASHFRIADLKARLSGEPVGTFAGADVRLAAVPLDLREAAGTWRYAGGRLTIDDARFRLEDRERVPRFEPLQAAGASLTLADNRITASARLSEPESRRDVTRVALVHDLATARGHADLDVARLTFDKALQPDQLTRQLLGVVANVSGTVEGEGRIDWAGDRLRSTGRFRTAALDLAAAFGPAKGIRGEVEFTDLLGLVTAPHQRITIASINPGIEALDGEMRFQLKPGSVVAIEGARWPFLGGAIALRPTELRFGVAETRRFVIDIAGLDAAHFIERMELSNLSANGSFDGSLPLVFDENGGRIEGGLLVSRPPGGNLSYVGALTYKDLSPIANFAFDALKSLDYRAMRIAMDGALEGEIVTRVRFDGVKQGDGTRQNILTRRLARLPLQFNVNLRAPFYSLITSVKAMYDPAYIKDPRSLGLVDAQGRPLSRPAQARPAAPGIQPPVSETKP